MPRKTTNPPIAYVRAITENRLLISQHRQKSNVVALKVPIDKFSDAFRHDSDLIFRRLIGMYPNVKTRKRTYAFELEIRRQYRLNELCGSLRRTKIADLPQIMESIVFRRSYAIDILARIFQSQNIAIFAEKALQSQEPLRFKTLGLLYD